MRMHRLLQLGLVGIAAFAVAQDGTVLRRELKEGTAEAYTVQFDMKKMIDMPSNGGEQEFSISGTMNCATKIGKFEADKKLSDVDVTLSKFKFQLGGMAQMMQGMIDQLPSEVKYATQVDDHNRWGAPKIDPKMAAMVGIAQMVAGGGWMEFATLPDQAVKVGDTWEQTVPKLPVFGNKEFKLKSTLTAEKTVNNVVVEVITVMGVLPMDMDMSSMMGGSGGADVTGGARLVGPLDYHMDVTIEKATGKLVELTATSSGKQKVDIPQNGLSMDVSGKSTTKWKPAGTASGPG